MVTEQDLKEQEEKMKDKTLMASKEDIKERGVLDRGFTTRSFLTTS